MKSRRFITFAALGVIVVLGLALGLGLGLGLHSNNNDSSSSTSALSADTRSTFSVGTNNVSQSSEFLLSSNGFVISNQTTTRYYQFNLTVMQAAPDGFVRNIIAVNGQFPGPLVEANTGDRIVVEVNNGLPNSTAVHWHGMYQNGTNWMDGTLGITQCGIPPGGSFTYNFTVPNQFGTFWYHAHASTQYGDGLVGPLIIHSPDEPYLQDYDEDLIVMVMDWYHAMSPVQLAWYLSSASYDILTDNYGIEPVPDNGLLNGMNNFNCSNLPSDSANPGELNRGCVDDAPLALFNFTSGKKYRLRFINTGAFAEFQISIDQHVLTVIEADATPVLPVQVDRFPIAVAQRYSVIVEANQTANNYWLRAMMSTGCFNEANPVLNPLVSAVIHYDGAPEEMPTSTDWSEAYEQDCVDLNNDDLEPYFSMAAPEQDVRYNLEFQFNMGGNGITLAYINGTSWMADTTQSSLQIANNASANNGVAAFPSNQLVLTPTANQTVVDIVLNSYDEGGHPFHFHGHTFWILASGDGYFDPSTPLNLTNPLVRDTFTVPAYGYTLVRFINDNPGMWAFHCHINWHMEAGLMFQVQSLPDQIMAWDIPTDVKDLCNSPYVGPQA